MNWKIKRQASVLIPVFLLFMVTFGSYLMPLAECLYEFDKPYYHSGGTGYFLVGVSNS